jgi:lipid-A-disaccharide synthase
MSPHIFLVAGEESGDRLGASLIAAIKLRVPGTRFSGVGGAHMAAEGIVSPFPLGDLAIIGVSAILGSLPKILQRIREAADAVVATKPDVLVIIDSPEFTHRVARRVRKIAPHIPIVDYVCPSVWAWRPGRARAMRSYVDHVLALLPFEPAAMQRLGGPPTTFVGHPLSERIDSLRPNAEEARRRMSDPPVLLVLPGSRSGEIHRLADVFGQAVALLAQRVGPFDVVVPAIPRLEAAVKAATASWPVPVRIVTSIEDKDAAFRIARAALSKSGTSTLELALAGVPMAAAYQVSFLEEMIGRAFIRVKSYILANLVLGENVVPEFLQHFCNPENLANALVPLMTDTPERRRQTEAFAGLDRVMAIGTAYPSERAADVILSCLPALNQVRTAGVAATQPRA